MTIVERLRWLVLTGFGLGLVPIAPGTFGTLAGVVPGAILCATMRDAPLAWTLFAVSFVLLLFGLTQNAFAKRAFAGDDPGQVVLDEIVGYLAALAIFAALAGHPTAVAQTAAFVGFRAFDVLKVPPANRLEELPGMAGVMLDDVAAGLWTGAALLLVHALGLL